MGKQKISTTKDSGILSKSSTESTKKIDVCLQTRICKIPRIRKSVAFRKTTKISAKTHKKTCTKEVTHN